MTTISSLENSPELSGIDFLRKEIHDRHIDQLNAQKEALVSSADVRQIIGEVAHIRGLEADVEYQDFTGLYASMRSAFDFRTKADGSHGERWEAEENAKQFLSECTPELSKKIYTIAEQFGYTGDTIPSDKRAKAAVILGGGGRSPLDRTQYTADLIAEGKLESDYIISLGSDRPIDTKRDEKGENEYDRAGEYALGAKTEYDLMVRAAEEVFGATISETDVIEWTDPEIMGGIPRIHKIAYIEANDVHPPIFIISSAILTYPFRTTKVKDRDMEVRRNRANTEDTFATLARMPGFDAGDKIVAVTNAHFKPFQGAAASGQLGEYGMDTEVVGYDPLRYGVAPKRSDELLQEMLTTASSLTKATK
jgi:hypothetical protein